MPRRPPPTLLLLVRHGKTPTTGQVLPGRAKGLHLSDDGRRQAENLATRLGEWSRSRPARNQVAAVYASPLERARETAAPLARTLGHKVVVEKGLNECDFGEWTGAALKDLARTPEWTTVQRYPSGFRFPGGESFAAMAARITDTLSALCARHRGETVVAVSHADPIKAAVAEAMGTHLDLFQRIQISPCSLTAVTVADTGPSVLAVNFTGSLGELVAS